jgi:hypothetical protein
MNHYKLARGTLAFKLSRQASGHAGPQGYSHHLGSQALGVEPR